MVPRQGRTGQDRAVDFRTLKQVSYVSLLRMCLLQEVASRVHCPRKLIHHVAYVYTYSSALPEGR